MKEYAELYGCTVDEFKDWVDFAKASGVKGSSISELIDNAEADHNVAASEIIGTHAITTDDPFVPEGARTLDPKLAESLAKHQKDAVRGVLQTGKDAVIMRRGYLMFVCIKGQEDDEITLLKHSGYRVFRTVLYRQECRKW